MIFKIHKLLYVTNCKRIAVCISVFSIFFYTVTYLILSLICVIRSFTLYLSVGIEFIISQLMFIYSSNVLYVIQVMFSYTFPTGSHLVILVNVRFV